MLRWRLLLGTLIIAMLIGLCWLDHAAATAGVWLLPVAILFTLAATGEILHLAAPGGSRPLAWPVYLGNLLLIAANWVPSVCCDDPTRATTLPPIAWPLLALFAGFLLVLVGEMCRYEKPGGVTANVAASVLALVYVGLLLGLVVQLRMGFGVAAVASLIIVVKLGDTGAYTVGRLIGRHKMAPRLSPGKTIEGAAGAVVFACLGSCATFYWLVPAMSGDKAASAAPWWGWILFGLLVATAGILGDLAESLIKRDAGCKDSSTWLPGFGGVLDILDSILLAAPVAWICWATGLVGR
ncbi:MAG: phosphatidate cytidylyltransferase [Candidatus Nealsonbacteria bacterium]|nr:phosphatidate cytidylyltransferase [Candidatus Nealsonbacteria bacterium]